MPKQSPARDRQANHWRSSPYGTPVWFQRSNWQTASALPYNQTAPLPGPSPSEETRSFQATSGSSALPRAFQLPPAVTSVTPPSGHRDRKTEAPSTMGGDNGLEVGEVLQGQDPNVPVPPVLGYTKRPNAGKSTTPAFKPKSERQLSMVDSMALQAVSRLDSKQPPGLSIYSNSQGGGVQFNIFTKIPNISKTIAFNVKSEEALVKVYRHVKAMNPSADVGGIMFCVASKSSSSKAEEIGWESLAGPPPNNHGRNHANGHSIPHGPSSDYYRPNLS
ncbi:hypothetical protein FHETE_10912 [Fusarium heterosporum]|uniref:Uncharacterized protein n=1 Tax=Fusarium heterosporum TaxID=42747 RepID=A0A8H5SN31_FUSHE|nr:hypothetical protein FHETE_10912 [Fusarium heterosporum]